jgi:hypothetical protein
MSKEEIVIEEEKTKIIAPNKVHSKDIVLKKVAKVSSLLKKLYTICEDLCVKGKIDYQIAPIIKIVHTQKEKKELNKIKKGEIVLPMENSSFTKQMPSLEVNTITIEGILRFYVTVIADSHKKYGGFTIDNLCSIHSIEKNVINLLCH